MQITGRQRVPLPAFGYAPSLRNPRSAISRHARAFAQGDWLPASFSAGRCASS
jgi:hypothetical protein